MKKYRVFFNNGSFFRTVSAKNEDEALHKAISRLSIRQQANYYNWEIIVV